MRQQSWEHTSGLQSSTSVLSPGDSRTCSQRHPKANINMIEDESNDSPSRQLLGISVDGASSAKPPSHGAQRDRSDLHRREDTASVRTLLVQSLRIRADAPCPPDGPIPRTAGASSNRA